MTAAAARIRTVDELRASLDSDCLPARVNVPAGTGEVHAAGKWRNIKRTPASSKHDRYDVIEIDGISGSLEVVWGPPGNTKAERARLR